MKETIIEKYAYAMANKQCEIIDGYCKLYIKKKPKYLPEFVYKYILKKVVVLANFEIVKE